MAQSLMMGYERLFLLSIFISAVICNESSDQFEDMNPILRKQSRNSRNCFFSPIQCHLPVAAINDMETLSKRRFRSKPW
uniref:Secreted protein n=1 Tax=Ascaris lumbricoides TaxID=6252 RepID=A0A0M3IIZ2_ASCLU